jgi:hypothetical protein
MIPGLNSRATVWVVPSGAARRSPSSRTTSPALIQAVQVDRVRQAERVDRAG